MKRSKAWWARLKPHERSCVVYYERHAHDYYGYGGGGYLPDDCTECSICGTPCRWSPCEGCDAEYDHIIRKAEAGGP